MKMKQKLRGDLFVHLEALKPTGGFLNLQRELDIVILHKINLFRAKVPRMIVCAGVEKITFFMK